MTDDALCRVVFTPAAACAITRMLGALAGICSPRRRGTTRPGGTRQMSHAADLPFPTVYEAMFSLPSGLAFAADDTPEPLRHAFAGIGDAFADADETRAEATSR